MYAVLLSLGCQVSLTLRHEDWATMEIDLAVDKHFCEVPRIRGAQEDAKSVFNPATFYNPRDEL